jgi:hypothetical protein
MAAPDDGQSPSGAGRPVNARQWNRRAREDPPRGRQQQQSGGLAPAPALDPFERREPVDGQVGIDSTRQSDPGRAPICDPIVDEPGNVEALRWIDRRQRESPRHVVVGRDNHDCPVPIRLDCLNDLSHDGVRGSNACFRGRSARARIVTDRVRLVELDEQQVQAGVGGGFKRMTADGRVRRVSVGVELGPGRHNRPGRPGALEFVERKDLLEFVVARHDRGSQPSGAGQMNDGRSGRPISPRPPRDGPRSPGSCAHARRSRAQAGQQRRKAGIGSRRQAAAAALGTVPAGLAQAPEVRSDGRAEGSKRKAVQGDEHDSGCIRH